MRFETVLIGVQGPTGPTGPQGEQGLPGDVGSHRYIKPEDYGPWDTSGATDNTATLLAAVAAGGAAGLPVDGGGATIGVTGDIVGSVSSLWLRNIRLKDLDPGAASRKVINCVGLDRVILDNVVIDRNGDGTGGPLATSASIHVEATDRVQIRECEIFGNNKGYGILVEDCISPQILLNTVHDMRYAHAGDTDDRVGGISILRCSDFLCHGNVVRSLGRIDQTTVERDRWSRGITVAASSGIVAENIVERVDQGFDLSGSATNRRITVRGNIVKHVVSWGIKVANSGSGVIVEGNHITQPGFIGIILSPPGGVLPNYVADILVADNIVLGVGASQYWVGSAQSGLRIENGAGDVIQYTPYGASVRGNKFIARTQSSAFTVFDTDELTIVSPILQDTGQRVRLTTTGTLPTGLATGTDYYIIALDSVEVVGTGGRIQLASSYINALDGVAITGISAGSGTHTITMQSDMDYGGINLPPFNAAYPPNRWGADNEVQGALVQDHFGFHHPSAQAKSDGQTFTHNVGADILVQSILLPGLGSFTADSAVVTIPYQGRWRFTAILAFVSNTTGVRQVHIATNIKTGDPPGALPGFTNDDFSFDRRPAADSGNITYIRTSRMYDLRTGDQLKAIGYQNSTGDLLASASLTLEPVSQ